MFDTERVTVELGIQYVHLGSVTSHLSPIPHEILPAHTFHAWCHAYLMDIFCVSFVARNLQTLMRQRKHLRHVRTVCSPKWKSTCNVDIWFNNACSVGYVLLDAKKKYESENCRYWCVLFLVDKGSVNSSVQTTDSFIIELIFPRGCANSQNWYYFSNFCRKLHKNERFWTRGGVLGAPLDPPMPTEKAKIYCTG